MKKIANLIFATIIIIFASNCSTSENIDDQSFNELIIYKDMPLELFLNQLAGVEGSVSINKTGSVDFESSTADIYEIQVITGCKRTNKIEFNFYFNPKTGIGQMKKILIDGNEDKVIDMPIQLKNLLHEVNFAKQNNLCHKDIVSKEKSENNKSGIISGNGSYPSDFIPDEINVYAYNIKTKEIIKHHIFDHETGKYEIKVPNGEYYVFSGSNDNINDKDNGFYSEMVPCGLTIDCKDHTLIKVIISDFSHASNINPGDWYMPE